MSRVRFKRRLYSLLEINGGEDLIPVFEEHIKKITGTIDITGALMIGGEGMNSHLVESTHAAALKKFLKL